MRDRLESILRAACLVLAVLLLAQLIRAGFRANPLAGVKIPPVPTLETNSTAVASVAPMPAVKTAGAVQPGGAATNLSAVKTAGTNRDHAATAHLSGTNMMVTNLMAGETTNNLLASGTNAPGQPHRKSKRPGMPAGMMAFGGFPMGPGMGGPAPKLPAEIQTRVDKIVNSEIFAPVIHPLPMGLMGIAGDTAFLRTDDGQTGLVKVGDSLGDLKLLRIGINRVLVEQDGVKKELMIFDGYGGVSLLQNDKPNENTHH